MTLDFEPTYFAPLEDGRGGLGIVPRGAIERMPAEAAIHLLPPADVRNIQGRLRVALSQPDTVIKSLDHFLAPRTVNTTVSLPDFGTWAAQIWAKEFPPKFPRNDAPVTETSVVTKAKEPAPHWKVYGSYVSATLAEAVALSHDLDPDDNSVRRLAQLEILRATGDLDDLALINNPPPYSAYQDAAFGARLDEFLRRFRIAINHVQSGTLMTSSGSVEGKVVLVDFGRWAASLTPPFDLPPQFPRGPTVTDQKSTMAPGSRKNTEALSTKERTNLLVIIGALAHKAGVDLTRTTVAAKEIERVVRADLKSKISVRTVEVHLKRVPDALDRKAPDSDE